MAAIKTVVVIPTFRREHWLLALLDQIGKVLRHRADFAVVVVNNDSTSQIDSLIDPDKYFYPLSIETEPRVGVANARNRLFRAALVRYPNARYLLMLDDDTLVRHDWLCELEGIAEITKADFVGGQQRLEIGQRLGVFVRQSYINRSDTRTNGLTWMLNGAGNVLIRRAFLENMSEPYFDEQFNNVGAEDVDFFTRARKSGAVFAWSENATIFERVDAARFLITSLFRRHYSMGLGLARVARKHFSFDRRVRTAPSLFLRALLSAIHTAYRQGVADGAARFLLHTSDAVGYVVGSCSIRAPKAFEDVTPAPTDLTGADAL